MGRLKNLAKNSPTAARASATQNYGEVATVGLSFVFALVIGAAIGWWLDNRYGWKPYGFLGGLGLGLAAGIRSVYVILHHVANRILVYTVVLTVTTMALPLAGTLGPLYLGGAAVLGGALISAISYLGIRRGVDGLSGAISGGDGTRATVTRALIILVGRYALLALIAYVMISRLRLSPLGLLLGVSVIPLAATTQTIEVLVALRKTTRGNHGKV